MMKLRLAVLAAAALGALSLAGVLIARDDTDEPEGVQIQARGPVHEAFAEASEGLVATDVVAPKVPPDPVEEAPPEERPEGDNVVWIPGYWAWDDQEEDFLWISGFWRAVPPGRVWVSGYWQKVSDGYRWVAGYWSDEKQAEEEAEYLPEPPDTLERGPSTPAPSEEYVYVPGIWVYQRKHVWRPGFWVKHRPGWVWVPDCYKWTPAGYVFVNGYWDVPLVERGLLFAPVRFTKRVYTRRDFVYRPAYVVQPDFLVGSLFVRAKTRKYYFGDYFDPRLRKRYVPWVEYRVAGVVPDVNYSYYRHAYAKHAAWERGVRSLYEARYRGDIARPPATLVQQSKVIDRIRSEKTAEKVVHKTVNITNVENVTALAPIRTAKSVRVTGLARLAGIRDTEEKSAPVAKTIRLDKGGDTIVKEEARQAERYRVIARERSAAEKKAAAKLPKDGKVKEPVKVRIEVPKTAPPPRKLKSPTPPPPPERAKPEDRPKDTSPKKDKDVPPPKDKDKGPPKKDKDKPPPPPKDKPKDKDKPPPPPKDKDKPPPPKDKDKPPPPPKDKDKPPPPPKDKEKPKKDKDVPPPKDKEKPPPPPPKDKDKEPPKKDKEKPPPPPPKDKDKPPPPPKDKEKPPKDSPN